MPYLVIFSFWLQIRYGRYKAFQLRVSGLLNSIRNKLVAVMAGADIVMYYLLLVN